MRGWHAIKNNPFEYYSIQFYSLYFCRVYGQQILNLSKRGGVWIKRDHRGTGRVGSEILPLGNMTLHNHSPVTKNWKLSSLCLKIRLEQQKNRVNNLRLSTDLLRIHYFRMVKKKDKKQEQEFVLTNKYQTDF